MSDPLSEFFLEIHQEQAAGRFVSLVMSKLAKGEQGPPRRDIRPLRVQQIPHWQWTHKEGWQELHENLNIESSLERLREWVPHRYRDATLITTEREVQFRQGKKSATIQRRQRTRSVPSQQHDRSKQYLIPESKPVPFLVELGVMTPAGQVKSDKQRKFRQINRYLEFVRDIAPQLPSAGALNVVDFGCGLSYLTFALHYYFQQVCQRDVNILGVDRNQSVIDRCQAITRKLQLQGLSFECRDVNSASALGPVHLVVSLHACDTATDAALLWAVQHQTDVLLSVPCCQHELAPQLDSPSLTLLSQHGILREQFSSLATDALRAAALEASGYATEVMEFIDLEHTAKNLLIRAVRQKSATDTRQKCQKALEDYWALKKLLGVQTLTTDQLLTIAGSAGN